jgi:hypothetical protein
MTRPSALAVVAAVALGCAGSPGRAPPPAQPPAGKTEAPTPLRLGPAVSRRLAPPRIKLVGAGATPARRLVYALPPEARETVQLDLHDRLHLEVGDVRPAEARPPGLRLTLALRARNLAGGFAIEGKIARATVLAGDASQSLEAAYRADVEGLVGAPLAVSFDARGAATELHLPDLQTAPPPIAALLARLGEVLPTLLAPLPDAAIGRGASWEIRRATAIGPVAVEELARVSLTELDGQRGRLEVALAHTAEPQPLAVPGLPPDARVTLKALSGEGRARRELRLDRIAQPAEASIASVGAGTATAPGEGPAEVRLRLAAKTRTSVAD